MSDLYGNHIVGFPTRRLNFFSHVRIESLLPVALSSVLIENHVVLHVKTTRFNAR